MNVGVQTVLVHVGNWTKQSPRMSRPHWAIRRRDPSSSRRPREQVSADAHSDRHDLARPAVIQLRIQPGEGFVLHGNGPAVRLIVEPTDELLATAGRLIEFGNPLD